jgi:type II secretory pathway pseudopilin PulG
MKFALTPPKASRHRHHHRSSAFTLVETMVTMLLLTILMIAGFGGLYSMDFCSRRVADYTAATSVVEAKLQDIKAVYYNPPIYPFTASTVYITNTDYVSLNKAGTGLRVAGTLVSEIKPVAAGHLVTVMGTFQEPRGALTVNLQAVVNKFSGGQQ